MAGKVLQLKNIATPDQLASQITNSWWQWNTDKEVIKERWKEVREYLYATDTKSTTNAQLPWKNTTTIPKLCQISDNLSANYMASMFPKRKWLIWEADNQADQDKDKTDAIRDYMSWTIDQPMYKEEVQKLCDDYLQYGNCFSTVEWADQRVQLQDKVQAGYVGPRFKRISPLDICFDPTAPTFVDTPKIVRSLISMGEAKETIERMSTTEDEKAVAQSVLDKMRELRLTVSQFTGTLETDDLYRMDGFGSYKDYLMSGYVELLYFYGDIYDLETGDLLKNYQIVILDRMHVGFKKPNPSYFGKAPIYHSGWRKRQDNLWCMGPLENLVGMQYRLDHVENMKADLFDLTAFPPIKRKGYVEDYVWGPMSEIVVGDDGDVEMMTPPANIMQFSQEINAYMTLMEQMAGAPQEAMGIRSPGEKTAYEVQTLENSRGRIFQAKISQFEEEQIEPGLNAMLELARRMMDSTVVRVIDDEFKINVFRTLTPDDITGSGRIKPVAARHFAEKAEMIQNLTQFFGSQLGKIVAPHTSGVKLAAMAENLLELGDWDIFQPNIAATEQADFAKIQNSNTEDVQAAAMTPAGIAHGDTPMPQGPPNAVG